MPPAGLEPARPFEHRPLMPTSLPIPSRWHYPLIGSRAPTAFHLNSLSLGLTELIEIAIKHPAEWTDFNSFLRKAIINSTFKYFNKLIESSAVDLGGFEPRL